MTTNTKFDFKAIDHLAITVSDMQRAVDFYHGKLGMPILYTMEYKNDADEVIGQHWYFGIGDDGSHLAIFYWKDGYQTLEGEKPKDTRKPANPRAYPIAELMHFNLRVDAERIEEYCEKLKEAEIPFTHTVRYRHPERDGVMTVDSVENEFLPAREGALMSSVYFSDPDGIALEFNAWFPTFASWPNDKTPMSDATVGA
ncbi:VOC family protein [Nocardioides acrostichi]|uniref:VOC family protein n=1 Tax=Nocardioides acrostichi TaxID=2784339 RepID=A0A930V079_9ACTN|nr:VOC family protein [Nocardioides acrostichi]MBF4163301.1 VOC family protein [Nocardioides acrostichi]